MLVLAGVNDLNGLGDWSDDLFFPDDSTVIDLAPVDYTVAPDPVFSDPSALPDPIPENVIPNLPNYTPGAPEMDYGPPVLESTATSADSDVLTGKTIPQIPDGSGGFKLDYEKIFSAAEKVFNKYQQSQVNSQRAAKGLPPLVYGPDGKPVVNRATGQFQIGNIGAQISSNTLLIGGAGIVGLLFLLKR